MEYIRIGPRVGPVTSIMVLASTRKARASADLREMIASACGLDKARTIAWNAFCSASEPASEKKGMSGSPDVGGRLRQSTTLEVDSGYSRVFRTQ